jgi:hypothetical protein
MFGHSKMDQQVRVKLFFANYNTSWALNSQDYIMCGLEDVLNLRAYTSPCFSVG